MATIEQELADYFELCETRAAASRLHNRLADQVTDKALRIRNSLELTKDERDGIVQTTRRIGPTRYRFRRMSIEVLPDDRIDPDKEV